ncbi:metallophosphoesterase [Brevundimonas sp. PWP3-1b1]|uniref:metallophosphoesterase n=1 Tax=unclassified Brevundimonas TaxID=2622653 RepID=UPI003CE707B4
MMIGLLAGALLASSPLAGQELHPETVPPHVAERWRAGGWPDRVVLTPGSDPAREMAVAWRTDPRQAAARAELALDDGGPEIEDQARDIDGRTVMLETPLGASAWHQARFTGLRPDTAYAYRLRGADGWGEWRAFRTAADHARPFRFVYLGDLQNDVLEVGARVMRQAQRTAPDAALVLHAGDLVQQRDGDPHDAEWGEWIESGGPLLASIPQVPAAGNHEYLETRAADGDTDYTRLGPHWPVQFALPEGGATGAENTTYMVDYQSVRFIVLDTTSALNFGTLEAQRDWLRQALDHSDARWNIVVMHHPLFSCGRNYEPTRIRSTFRTVLEAGGADLVLQGHDHCYSRTSDPDGGALEPGGRRFTKGPVYVVSIAGSKMYALNPQSAEQADVRIGDTQLFQVVDVSTDRLTFRTFDATGRRLDAFDIEKSSKGREVIDRR